MQPLLSKTTRPFLIYVLFILLISVPVYYFVVKKIWISELDEHNKIIAQTTEARFKQLALPEHELKEKIKFWNTIQPGISIAESPPVNTTDDSAFTISADNLNLAHHTHDNFRVLITTIDINGRPYPFRSITNYEDTKETISAITIVTFFFFGCIVAGLFVINRKLSRTVWRPFRNTLERLKMFNLNNQSSIVFDKTSTAEFDELNQSLDKLVSHTISVYRTQKEFTENASHELQTPLAILKNKLDLLLQSDDLTEQQYNIAEEMNKALIRSSRINKNLLLLAKIDSKQFDSSELISFDSLLLQNMDLLLEHFEQKNIRITTDITYDVQIKGNSSLVDVLINNLLLNAIRYSPHGSSVNVSLSKSTFEVANSGVRALNADLLFQRFSRLTTDGNGSGLGLSIVQEICRFHNWHIQYRFVNYRHIFTVDMGVQKVF